MSIYVNEILTFSLELICPYCLYIIANYAEILEKMSIGGLKVFISIVCRSLHVLKPIFLSCMQTLRKKNK